MTIKEIAAHLNISTTTVSNVIHGKTKEVSQDTVDRVQAYLKEVHYTPNITARNLAQNRSKIIGLVLKTTDYQHINMFTDPFVSELIGSIERTIREAGYFMMLYISDNVGQIIRDVSAWNADGLILFAMDDEDVIRFNQEYHKPVVFIDTYMSENTELHMQKWFINVGLDDEGICYQTTKYLIEKGHRRIGFVTRNYLGTDSARFRGFRRAMKEIGMDYPKQDIMLRFSEDRTYTYEEMAEKAEAYTAVISCSDSTAILLMNALQKRGKRIPEDISIVGFDNNSNCVFANPPLTTVDQDITRKGVTAVNTLLNMIRGIEPPRHDLILKTELIERESVCDLTKVDKNTQKIKNLL